MPIFLIREQIYRLIQRELPVGHAPIFPDGAPSSFYHTAEMDSYAQVFATAYVAASGIYENSFPVSCDDVAINQWEIKVFGQLGDSTLTLLQRQALILAKLQTKRGITLNDMVGIVRSTIPGLTYGADFEIVSWCCGKGLGGWVLDISQLDLETYLNYDTQFSGPVGPSLCESTPEDWGMTPEDWANLQAFAYTFEVRFYGYPLSDQQKKNLDAALSAGEPARSTHVIRDGLNSLDNLGGIVQCATSDSSSGMIDFGMVFNPDLTVPWIVKQNVRLGVGGLYDWSNVGPPGFDTGIDFAISSDQVSVSLAAGPLNYVQVTFAYPDDGLFHKVEVRWDGSLLASGLTLLIDDAEVAPNVDNDTLSGMSTAGTGTLQLFAQTPSEFNQLSISEDGSILHYYNLFTGAADSFGGPDGVLTDVSFETVEILNG